MTLLARTPRNCAYRDLRDDTWMPSILNDWFNTVWPATSEQHYGDFIPKMNVSETDKEYKLELAVPGMTKDHINLRIEDDDTLVIKAEKEHLDDKKADKEQHPDRKADKNEGWLRREFWYNSFEQRFTLPDDADVEAINASMSDGILTVTLPKKAPVAPEKLHRVIEVK